MCHLVSRDSIHNRVMLMPRRRLALKIAAALLLLLTSAYPAACELDRSDVELISGAVAGLLRSIVDTPGDEELGKVAAWSPYDPISVSKEMLPGLLEDLKNKDYRVRGRAATAIGFIGADAAEAVTELKKHLNDKSGAVQAAAAGAIWMITSEADEMCPKLQRLLRGKARAYHIYAANALGAVGPPAKCAIPLLIEALAKDEYPGVRAASAVALLRIGDYSPSVLAALDRAKGDKEQIVRETADKAATVLRSQSGPLLPTIEELMAHYSDADWKDRAHNAFLTGLHGEKAAKAVPALIRLLSDKEMMVRANATYALGKIGAPAKDALPILAAQIKDQSVLIRGRSATAIAVHGEAAKAYLPVLENALDSDQDVSKAGIAAAIWRITGDSSKLLSVIRKFLSSEDVAMRLNGVVAVARVGSIGKEAEPLVLTALADEDPAVRTAAAYAMASINDAKPEVLAMLEWDTYKAGVDLANQLESGTTPQASKPPAISPAQTTSLPIATLTEALSLSGVVSYEPDEAQRQYGLKTGPVGEISLKLTPTSDDRMAAEGTINIKIAEKPYYVESEITHAIKAELVGEGQRSPDGKWQFSIGSAYKEKVDGAVSYESDGKLTVHFDLAPDGSAEGVIEGLQPWSPCRFKASAK